MGLKCELLLGPGSLLSLQCFRTLPLHTLFLRPFPLCPIPLYTLSLRTLSLHTLEPFTFLLCLASFFLLSEALLLVRLPPTSFLLLFFLLVEFVGSALDLSELPLLLLFFELALALAFLLQEFLAFFDLQAFLLLLL